VKTEQSEKNAGKCFGKVAEYYQRQGEVSGDQKKADEYSEQVRRYRLQTKLGKFRHLSGKGLPLVIFAPGNKQRYVKGGCVAKPHEYRLEMK